MKTRKNILVKTIYIATLLITFAAFAVGCGKTTPDTHEESKKTDTTEVSTEVETETTEEPEVPVETETEEETEEPEVVEEVLFSVCILDVNGNGFIIVPDYPSDFEYSETYMIYPGTYFEVYEVVENQDEGLTYYRIKVEDGKTAYVRAESTEKVQ